MDFPENEINELKQMFSDVSYASEGGYDYFLIRNVKLPPPCLPECIDVLLCPNDREGYISRLYFAEKITCNNTFNWNGSALILDRQWHAFSWKLQPAERRLAQMLTSHLRALS